MSKGVHDMLIIPIISKKSQVMEPSQIYGLQIHQLKYPNPACHKCNLGTLGVLKTTTIAIIISRTTWLTT
jgi:hypothetical protein